MQQRANNRYDARLKRVTDYIYENLDQDIDLLHLAEIACMSPFHWHRIYQAVYGETIAATVRRLRLARAAADLTNTDKPVQEVAKRAGFHNIQSFTRLFKKHYGIPPAKYRQCGTHALFSIPFEEMEANMYNVTIDNFPALRVATIPHEGDYMNVGSAFDKMFRNLDPATIDWSRNRTVGIFLDDPEAVPTEKLRSYAGVTVGFNHAIKAPFQEFDIPAARYAVLRHKGPYSDIRKAYKWLFEQWLLNSDEEPGNSPCYEDYLNNPRDVPATELLTDIYLPLTSKAG